nr:MAG TPA: hypothetical protein [Caudoviricetes sp.]
MPIAKRLARPYNLRKIKSPAISNRAKIFNLRIIL